MILLLLSFAFAQKLPNEISASRTCGLIAGYYQRESESIAKKNDEMRKHCSALKKRTPKEMQKFLNCYEYFVDESQLIFLNNQRFHVECEKVLSKVDVKKHLFGPMRAEDYEVKPIEARY